MLRRMLVTAALVAVAGALGVSAATADPTHAKGATQVEVLCGGKPVMVVVNGNGKFTPAHVLGSTSVFVPTSLDLTFTFTPSGGSPMKETQTATKAAPLQNTTTCTIPLQTLFSGPEGTATIEGTVTGFFTPR